MKFIACSLVALFALFSCPASAQEADHHGPTYTLTTTLVTGYVIPAGVRLTDKAGVEQDIWIEWANGTYIDIWACASLATPGADAKHGPGNEIDPVAIGHRFNVGKFRITPEFAYYMFVPMSDFGNDMVQARVKIDRPLEIGDWSITPYVDLKAYEPTSSAGFPAGRLYYLGMSVAHRRFALDASLIYDDGVGGDVPGTILRLAPSVTLWEKSGTALVIGTKLTTPVSGASDRGFEHVETLALRYTFK